MIHSILLIGQSNMAGRGRCDEVAPINNMDGRIKVLRNGRWLNAYRPINPDREMAGVCLAESFATEYASAHGDVDIGLIPCADGGTSLAQWQRGGLLFDNAVNMTKLALRTSNLVAILWHQGEADLSEGRHHDYCERLLSMMSALREEIGAPDVPIIVGGLGDFLKDLKECPSLKDYPLLNAQLKSFAGRTPRAAYASAEGLPSNPDNLHFSASALLELGGRYYRAFETVEDKRRTFEDKSDMDAAIRSKMELL